MKIINRIEDRRSDMDMSVPKKRRPCNERVARDIRQEAGIVSLGATPGTPGLYGENGIVGRVGTVAAPGILAQLRQRLKDEYPDLRQEAQHAIEARLHSEYGIDINADKTWFNTFTGAASSSRSYNGWEHAGRPLVSLKLTDLQLQNFPADFGEDSNGLNANSGVYRVGASATRFDAGNEVRLLSSDLKAAIRDDDFQATYRAKMAHYWERNESAVALHYEALALEHSQDGGLSSEARTLLTQAAGYHDAGSVTWRAYAFDINSYVSKDMSWLQADDGRVVLLTPHATKPLREYANVDDMRRGVAELARTRDGRDEILRGFSIYNQQDGVIYQGVEKWLGDIAAGGYDERIAMRPKRIEGKLFADMAHRSREAALDDVSRLIRSNADVGKQELLQALRAFNDVMGSGLTQLGEAGYALYAARTEGLMEDRQDAASKAWVAGLGAAVMMLFDGVGEHLAEMGAPAPKVLYRPPTRLSDGRIGYPLGPVNPPRLLLEAGMPGGSGNRFRAPASHQNGAYQPAINYPMQAQAIDLSRNPAMPRYRDGGHAAAGADIPASDDADGGLNEPLDLSTRPRPPLDEQVQAGPSRPADPAPLTQPLTSSQINPLGFSERQDFQDLYGFQSFGGVRNSRRVASLDLNPPGSGIAPMIEGDMLRTFTTLEAANEAARRAPLRHYWIYRIRADGMRAASLQDNRLNNPLFESLRLRLTQAADSVTQPRERTLLRNRLLYEAEQEVHLSTGGLTPERVTYLQRFHTRARH